VACSIGHCLFVAVFCVEPLFVACLRSHLAKRGFAVTKQLKKYRFVFLCLIFLGLAAMFYVRIREHLNSLPDLSGCTRIELTYLPSARGYFGIGHAGEGFETFFSNEETELMASLDRVVVTDARMIKALAKKIRYKLCNQTGVKDRGGIRGKIGRNDGAYIEGYEGSKLTHTIHISGESFLIHEESGRSYQYWKVDALDFTFLCPALTGFSQRLECGGNLDVLFMERERLSPPKWCDGYIGKTANDLSSEALRMFKRDLKCPACKRGRCNYAMNKDWYMGCLPDTVFLFEAKPGWNQYGGPELFTLDNHTPEGACVLLHDGTIKFVRTKEELMQLRWK
jgi:hypothetical protein